MNQFSRKRYIAMGAVATAAVGLGGDIYRWRKAALRTRDAATSTTRTGMKLFIAFAALAALAPHAAAQQPVAKPHPADPAASVPAVKYESAFSGYRSFREEPLAPWRDVNDEVARVGGHIGIAGGAGHGTAKPAPKPQTPGATSSPKTQPKPAQHGGMHR